MVTYLCDVSVQSGELKVTNHTTGERCHVKYHAYSYFSREQQRKVRTIVEANKCRYYM